MVSRISKAGEPASLVKSRKVREALAWIEKDPERLLATFPRLSFSDQLDLILLTSGDVRQELIASSPYAEKLVASLSEQEVYLTLKDIGLSHAAALLSLMTPDQDRFLGDLELWTKETFDPARFLELCGIVHHCGEDRLARWLGSMDPELLVLALIRHGRVSKFDPSIDPLEESDAAPFISYEGYYRYHPAEEALRPLIDPLIRILHAKDAERYGMVMESTYRDQPAEVELEAHRWRESRLDDKGFPAFEEACQIYRPLSEADFQRLVRDVPLGRMDSPDAAAILYPVLWIPADSFLRRALRKVATGPQRDRVLTELAALGNKVLVADGLDFGDGWALKSSLEKAAGCLTIGLQDLTGGRVDEAASWMSRTWLHFLFRLGYGQVKRLADRAIKLQPATRFRWIDHFHYLPDSPLEETLLGLVRPRPLLAVAPTPENFLGCREFASLQDIYLAEKRLACIEALADLFSLRLGLPPERIKEICIHGGMGDRLNTVKWSQVLHTMWANKLLIDRWEFQPLVPGQVRRFLDAAFRGRKAGRTGKLNSAVVRDLLKWVDDALGDLEKSGRAAVRATLLKDVQRFEQELGGLAENAPIDGRFIQSLWIR